MWLTAPRVTGATLLQCLNKHIPMNLTSLSRYHYLLNFKIKISHNLIFLLPTGSTLPHILLHSASWFCDEGLEANLFKRAGAFCHCHPEWAFCALSWSNTLLQWNDAAIHPLLIKYSAELCACLRVPAFPCLLPYRATWLLSIWRLFLSDGNMPT